MNELYRIFTVKSTGCRAKVFCAESQGVPRRINIVCDTALVYGCSAGAVKIDLRLVRKMIQDRHDFGVLGSQKDIAAE